MITASKSIATVRKDMNLIKVPGSETKTWKGINHGQLATAVIHRVQAAGLSIADEKWYVNPKKTIMWGAIDINPGSGLPSLEIGQDAKFSMGIRHGNGGEYAVSFAVGARIGICDNGMFAGDFVMKRKHTPSLALEPMIDSAIERYITQCEALENLINGWRGVEINDRDAAYLILEASKRDYVNFQHLEDVEINWSTPPHEEFQPRTAWSLYNAFTEMAKTKLTPPRQLKLLTGLRKMFDGEFGIGDAYLGPDKVSLN